MLNFRVFPIVLLASSFVFASSSSVASVRTLVEELRGGNSVRHGSPLPPEDTEAARALATALAIALYPYYRAESTKVEMTTTAPSVYTPFAPLNEIGSQRELADETVTWIPSPSRDVLYQGLWSYLGLGHAYVLHFGAAPDGMYRGWEIKKGSNLYPFLLVDPSNHDMTAHSHDILLVGEATGKLLDEQLKNWRRHLPAGYEVVVCPSVWLWITGRLEVKSGVTMSALHEIQDNASYEPAESALGANNAISRALARMEKQEPVEYTVPSGDGVDAELSFWYAVGEYLKANPLEADSEWVWQYAPRVGLEKSGFNPSALTADQLAAIKQGFNDAMTVIMDNLFQWGYHETTWRGITEYDQIYTDGALDAIDWATYCLFGKSALPPDGAIYFFSWAYLENWAFGGLLNGSMQYQVIFTAGAPPVDAFWSITVYEMNQMLVSAPYMLGSSSGIVAGTPLVLCMGPTHDEALCARQNYLPTPDGRQFMVEIRMFLAGQAVHDHTYTLPYIIHPTQ